MTAHSKLYFAFVTDVLSTPTFHKGVSSSNQVDSAVRSHNVPEELEQELDREQGSELDQEPSQELDQDPEQFQVHEFQ
jgi:hypothetical protein